VPAQLVTPAFPMCAPWRLRQNFIFLAISSYGSLVNITITTTRKARAKAEPAA
jgi:hypothetical protein